MVIHINCLITAIGSYSAEAVISSMKKNNIHKVVGCDIYPKTWVANSSFVDSFYQIPAASDYAAYIDALIQIINKEKIDYIIPLTDPEVDILTEYRPEIEKFNGILCIPDKKTVDTCRDKYAFYDYFINDSKISLIPTIKSSDYESNSFGFPLIVKPRRGRSSQGVYHITDSEELNFHMRKCDNYIIQPILPGSIFSVDLIRDRIHSKSFAISRKELIRTKHGAGLVVEVSINHSLEMLTKHIGDKLDINGCINMEFINHKQKYYLMDINPRFSSGVSFSYLAGYDMVINHLNCFHGNIIQDLIPFQPMIIAKKHTDVITCFDPNQEVWDQTNLTDKTY